MRLRTTLPIVPLLLAGCGGSHSDPAVPTGLTPTTAGTAAATVLAAESTAQASPTGLPMWVPLDKTGEGTAFGLQTPFTLPACASITTTGPDAQGFTHQTWTFTNCMEGDETLNGSIEVTWKQYDYQITFHHLVKSEDGGQETFTVDGTRHVVIDPVAKQATLTVTGFSLSHTEADEPSENRSFTYSAAYTSDWATAGQFKLWGTFTLQANADPALTGTIAQGTALTWTAGCCRPTSGLLALAQAGKTAEVQFGLPCGTITVTVSGQPAITRRLRGCH